MEYAVGMAVTIPLRNRSAQADSTRAQLDERQAESFLQRSRNQIESEVRNAIISLMQSKARVEAAQKTREYNQQTADAERKKLIAGVSTPYNVILAQRDLLSAQFAEVQARAAYAKARVEMSRSTGVILEENHIDVDQIIQGTPSTPQPPAGSQ